MSSEQNQSDNPTLPPQIPADLDQPESITGVSITMNPTSSDLPAAVEVAVTSEHLQDPALDEPIIDDSEPVSEPVQEAAPAAVQENIRPKQSVTQGIDIHHTAKLTSGDYLSLPASFED
jgi:hypothetical protein